MWSSAFIAQNPGFQDRNEPPLTVSSITVPKIVQPRTDGPAVVMQTKRKQQKLNALRAFQWIILSLIVQTTNVFGLNFNVTLASLTNHNTSAYPAYNQANFPANFGTTSWVKPDG